MKNLVIEEACTSKLQFRCEHIRETGVSRYIFEGEKTWRILLFWGLGVMGTAFGFPLVDAGQQVHLVGTHLDNEWIEGIRSTGIHPKLKAKLPENITPFTHDQLGEALSENTDLLVLGVSSPGS